MTTTTTMNASRRCFTVLFAAGLLGFTEARLAAIPLGTGFVYQGRLMEGGQPASGNYDLGFRLFDASTGGSPLTSRLTNSAVAVSNGLFTVTLDFGPGVFAGEARWLEIGVRTNGGAGDFTGLMPRQPLTPSPHALFAVQAARASMADSAGTAASVAGNGVSGASLQSNSVTSEKIADGTINPADLSAALASNTFWRLG